jgi:DNA-binding MarR family transcriptional regulator
MPNAHDADEFDLGSDSEIRLHGVAKSYPASTELVTALRAVLAVLRPHFNDVSELKGQIGLAPRHVHLMIQLAMGGAQSVSDLARQLSLTLASASQAVNVLAERGYVVRHEDPSDHRRTIVSLSAVTAASAQAIATSRLAPLERVLSTIESETLHTVTRTLNTIALKLVDELHRTDTSASVTASPFTKDRTDEVAPTQEQQPSLRFTENRHNFGGTNS